MTTQDDAVLIKRGFYLQKTTHKLLENTVFKPISSCLRGVVVILSVSKLDICGGF